MKPITTSDHLSPMTLSSLTTGHRRIFLFESLFLNHCFSDFFRIGLVKNNRFESLDINWMTMY